jgi:putative ABC transport system permease protein
MYARIIRNDIRRSRLASLATTLFVAVSALLVSLAGTLVAELSTALAALMERAATPHLLQMHSGPIDLPRLDAFAAGRPEVESIQVLEFLNLEGSAFEFGDRTLAGSVQDNGLAVQGRDFDFLLDLDGNVARPGEGELYIPVFYFKDGTARAGDRVRIQGREFRVAGFVRDSQMNSALSSSKRFLVNEADYSALRDRGSVEYLIEFRLRDPGALGALESAYVEAGLESNGPRVGFPLFRMMNALSDGLLIVVLLFVGLLVTLVALLCVRFALLAKIEQDYREIGAMKAVGLRVSDIRGAYLAKYAVLAVPGALLGWALSFAFRGPLLANLRLFMGEGGAAGAPVFGFAGAALVALLVLTFVRGVLGRFRKISAAEALRFGAPRQASRGPGRLRLAAGLPLGANAALGFLDVLARKPLYGTMLAVLVASSFIAVVPRNLHTTVASPSFSSYLGIGACDLRADIQAVGDIPGRASEIESALAADPEILKTVVLTARAFTVRGEDDSESSLKVELGDHSVFPVAYAEGRAPGAPGEIALSVLSAEDLGKRVGDRLPTAAGGAWRDLTVTGLYSDVTNGGKTAKAAFPGGEAPVLWAVVQAELRDPTRSREMAEACAAAFPYAKVSSLEEYVAQTFGPTIRAIGSASRISLAVALVLAVLITALFVRMLVARDRVSIAALRALGFRNSDIARQYLARSALVAGIGVLAGSLLANTLGESLVGALISLFGASSFEFAADPLSAWLLIPLAVALSALAATAAGAAGAGRIGIAQTIRE